MFIVAREASPKRLDFVCYLQPTKLTQEEPDHVKLKVWWNLVHALDACDPCYLTDTSHEGCSNTKPLLLFAILFLTCVHGTDLDTARTTYID